MLKGKTRTIVLAAALAVAATGAHAGGWDGFIRSNLSQFGEPTRLEMLDHGNGYRLKEQNYAFPVHFRAEVSGPRSIEGLEVRVKTIFEGEGKAYKPFKDTSGKVYDRKTTFYMDRGHLAPMEKMGAKICAEQGGTSAKEVPMNVPVQMTVYFTPENKSHGSEKFTKDGTLPARFVCHLKTKRVPPASIAVTEVKLYALHSTQGCPRNVVLTTEIWSDKPGKVEFQLVRQDGEMQNVSIQTVQQGNRAVRRWAKTYHFANSVDRKYMVIVKGHKFSTEWVPVKVQCGVANDHTKPGGLTGGSKPTHSPYKPGVVNPTGLKQPAFNSGAVQPTKVNPTYQRKYIGKHKG